MTDGQRTGDLLGAARVLGIVAALTFVLAVMSVGSLTEKEWVALGGLGAGWTIALWLPVRWVHHADSTTSWSLLLVWVGAAVALLPGPWVVVLGAVASLLARVLTCLFGDGVVRTPLNAVTESINFSFGTLSTAAAVGAAAAVGPSLAVRAIVGAGTAALVAMVFAGLIESRATAVDFGQLLRRLPRRAGWITLLTVLSAPLAVAAVQLYGVFAPVLAGVLLMVLLWRQAATVHTYRSVTEALLGLTTTAASATSVVEVQEIVHDMGGKILGRPVHLVTAGSSSGSRAVAVHPVEGPDSWALEVGVGVTARPFRLGPRNRRVLEGLASVARVALDAAQGHEHVRSQATHDSLTGLLNRRGFSEEGGRVVRRANRDGRECTLVYIDLNRLKRINDEHGHAAGDAVVAAVGEALRTHLRPVDLAARLGGDEFAVLFGEAVAEHAAAERVDKALAGLPHDADGAIGVARGRLDLEGLMAQADEHMYATKVAGRTGTPAPDVRP